MESEETVAQLRHRVTSPGATTEAGIHILEEGKIRELFIHALQGAKKRSEELADIFGKEV